jgi:hypothetical protein
VENGKAELSLLVLSFITSRTKGKEKERNKENLRKYFLNSLHITSMQAAVFDIQAFLHVHTADGIYYSSSKLLVNTMRGDI